MWRDVADWLHRGFDAVVVAHGQSGSGKTRALFGDGGGAAAATGRVWCRASSARSSRDETGTKTLHGGARGATPKHEGSNAVRFAVSAWELLPNGDALDLLDPSGSGKGFAVSGSGSHGGAATASGRAIASRACVASRFETRRRARRR